MRCSPAQELQSRGRFGFGWGPFPSPSLSLSLAVDLSARGWGSVPQSHPSLVALLQEGSPSKALFGRKSSFTGTPYTECEV